VSETTTTNPVGTESSEGSGRRRNSGEIQDALTTILGGEYAEPQEEEQHSDSDLEDGIEEDGIEAESYEDSEAVNEMDEETDGEYSESESASYRVIIDGKETQVPLDELISGYQRGSSFTQKSQVLAEERKNFEANAEAIQQERQSYSDVVAQLRQQMDAAQQPNIDWDRLEKDNPVQWLKEKQLERDRQGQVQAVQIEQSRMQQLLHDQNQQELGQRLESERTLVLEKIPEWSDSNIQSNEQRALAEFGASVGFSREELDTIYDHRALMVLRDAWKYNQLVNGEKVQSVKSKIKNAKPGGKQISQQMRGRKHKDQRAKLKQTGKVKDAASLLGALLTE